MTDWIAKAKARRELYERQGALLTDKQAASVVEAYPEWKPGTKITEEMIAAGLNRYRIGKQLYKTTVPHTTTAAWSPELAPTVWTPINIEHSGTLQDPIPAAVGLLYKQGLYYIEDDGTIYLCIRQDKPEGTELHYLPSQLVGIYFEKQEV